MSLRRDGLFDRRLEIPTATTFESFAPTMKSVSTDQDGLRLVPEFGRLYLPVRAGFLISRTPTSCGCVEIRAKTRGESWSGGFPERRKRDQLPYAHKSWSHGDTPYVTAVTRWFQARTSSGTRIVSAHTGTFEKRHMRCLVPSVAQTFSPMLKFEFPPQIFHSRWWSDEFARIHTAQSFRRQPI
jgi:hypothetical protein